MQHSDNSVIQQAFYMKGLNDGVEIGFPMGYIKGVEDTVGKIGHDASQRLREGKGDVMAYYRNLKKDMKPR
ncbi:hypothetical protein E5161_20560 [Cohnella pontilimi]|uniref:Uncharacterized protein n=1 Tax=Cohnella pontilimi TaxID=2564100 RepID=A0A4U0F026_9BACL|nr:hypothetical protein [Cohnella pontilimi]TJY37550.1 hypothetical protein E5161_20560 [Cohnella pontilimi]